MPVVEDAPAEFEEPPYTPGLIVHVANLHPATNKPTVTAFLARAADRYLRKCGEQPRSLQINYVDYKKGADTAYLRFGSAADADLVVKALEKRRRAMKSAEDAKGSVDKVAYVKGRLLEGGEERIYWERVGEGRGKGKVHLAVGVKRRAEDEGEDDRGKRLKY